MSKTIAEITKEVLEEIGRLQEGQVATAAQLQTVEDSYDGLWEELYNDSAIAWASDDDIEDYAADAIIILLAGRVAGRFGVPNVWKQLEPLQKRKLRQQMASPYEPQPTQADHF